MEVMTKFLKRKIKMLNDLLLLSGTDIPFQQAQISILERMANPELHLDTRA